jgi:hypothetical protein
MEQEFLDWFKNNEIRFHQSQFDDRQIAYSAWLEGRNKALQQHNVMESLPPQELDDYTKGTHRWIR